jgi:TPR repeat protein
MTWELPRLASKFLLIAMLSAPCFSAANPNENNLTLLREQATAGDVPSQLKLGKALYFQRVLYPFLLPEAEKWLKKVADEGSAEGQYYLGNLYYEKNPSFNPEIRPYSYLAFEYFKKSADQNYAYAQAAVSLCYERGEGVTKDLAKSFEYLLKAAERGLNGPQWMLGKKYENGKGVPKNYKKALEWYRRSALQGLVPAQFDTGRMFFNGYGTARNPVEAYFWWLLVAAKAPEFHDAAKSRDLVETELTAVQVEETQQRAARWSATTEVTPN